MRASSIVLLFGCLALTIADAAIADETANEGQADLDRAIEAKLSAASIRDLNSVISLCENALEKGLSEKNQEFAKQLLASALMERGSSIGQMVFGRSPPPPQWPQMRQIALADLERALQYDSALVEAQLLVARLQIMPGGSRKRALAAMDEVIKLRGDDPAKQAEALMMRASIQESPEKALADLDKVIELTPNESKAWRSRAAVKLLQKDIDAALRDIDKALEIDPKDAESHRDKGLALAAQKKWDESLACLNRAIELDPKSLNILLERGRVHAAAGDMTSALVDFSEVLRIEPDNIMALMLRAEAAAEDHPEEAIEDLDRILTLRPDLVPVLRQRSALLASSGKYSAAIRDLELVRKLAPEDRNAWLQLAAVYSLSGQSVEAARVYDEVLEADPNNLLAMRGRADANLNQGNQRAAIEDYERALRINSEDSGVLNNLAWVLATSPDEKLRDGKRAIELATKACEKTDYKQAHILSTLAAGYAETGDFEKAIELSKKALDIVDKKTRPALEKELESYQASKPWRESQTAASASSKKDESTDP